jgi:histidinol dehydrogenase
MPNYIKSAAPNLHVRPLSTSVPEIVKGVIDDIRSNGDVSVRQYSEKFDKWSPVSFKLSEEEIKDIISRVPEQTIKDIKEVQENVRKFAIAQRKSISDIEIEIQPGVHLGHKNLPISSVGAYVPFLLLLLFFGCKVLIYVIVTSLVVATLSSHPRT